MLKLSKGRLRRKTFRWLKLAYKHFRKAPLPIRIAIIAIAVAVVWMPYSLIMTPYYTTNYAPLLDAIAQGESKGNYNAYYGHAGNTSVQFTAMTIAQVLQWQQTYLNQGSPSSAVGKYQLLRSTLAGLVQQLHLDPNTTYFNEQTQDQLAVTLLERHGAESFLSGKLSREQFATNLSREWAALPKAVGPHPEQSYYAGDGLNQSRVSVSEIDQALDIIKSNRTVSQ